MKTRSFTTIVSTALIALAVPAMVSASPNRTIFSPLSPNARLAIQTIPHGTPVLSPSLSCRVQGNPSEFPNDLLISAQFAIAAGTMIAWSIPSNGESGTAVLPALAAGQSHYVQNVFAGGISPTICLASIL